MNPPCLSVESNADISDIQLGELTNFDIPLQVFGGKLVCLCSIWLRFLSSVPSSPRSSDTSKDESDFGVFLWHIELEP
jgi:hypothetical protein